MKACFTNLLWLFLFAITSPATAFHIVGGDLNMAYLGKPGYFRVTLNQYWDEASIAQNPGTVYETSVTIFVFSLRTRQFVEKFVLTQTDKQPLTYRNQACVQSTGLRTSEVHYNADIQFSPSRYTDSQGYYMVWERCCRNGSITNIATPGQVGQVFYLEFPAMQQNGVDFIDSSPAFTLPNGEYICINKPFTFAFGATDADGDQLAYQLVTPWAGYTSTKQIVGDGLSHPFYPTVTWLSGYSDQAMIPGSAPLKINAQTGQLSVTANQQGLFVFAVEVTEYRNGVAIGKVRREFQLFVTDCSSNVPPQAVVSYQNQPVSKVEFCAGGTVPLTVDANPKWAYQWQKDGNNLTGATSSTLVVQDAGNYTVIKSLAQICSRDTISAAVEVIKRNSPTVKITPSPSLTVCAGTPISLQAQPTNGAFRWLFNQKSTASLPTTSLISVSESGLYTVKYTEAGNPCPGQDSVLVVVNPLPTVAITSNPAVICGTDTALLSTTAIAKNRYAWTRSGSTGQLSTVATLAASQAGTYEVMVTDSNKCSATAQFTLTQSPKPTIRFDSLAPVCNVAGPAVALAAQPSGGQFSGAGITGNSFDPAQTGAGRFTITYRYTDAAGCSDAQKRVITVQEPIGLSVPNNLVLVKGDSVLIPATVKTAISAIEWSAPAGLNSASILQPTTGTQESVTYTIRVETPLGCLAEAEVAIRVVQRLLLPTAFTPNGDGQNDTWAIHGIDGFSQAEVFIYDRWGSVIYHSVGYDQPWDGTYQHQRVAPGNYAYRVLTGIDSVQYAGHVLVLY